LAPNDEILKPYKNKEMSWEKYEDKFMNLMSQRNIEKYVDLKILDHGCLLCSEHEPHYCHRRLVLEYLEKNTSLHMRVSHLVKM
jgi:uncharacterized protein YeaO (DUF488 family)